MMSIIENLHELSASSAAQHIRRREITSRDLVSSCIARIEKREPVVRAFAYFDPELALAQANICDSGKSRGILQGVPVGVKDIFATRDMPTRYNSPIYEGNRPLYDAACVERLRDAGAIILGKTVTAEFAYVTPGPTTNPTDCRHSPGGSSSGSAAGTADLFFPLALGSQTGGSAIRPASFCGIFGFKPTYGVLPTDGMKPLAPSLDTVGIFARTIEDLTMMLMVLGQGAWKKDELLIPPRILLCDRFLVDFAERPARETLLRFAETFAAKGGQIAQGELPAIFDELPRACLTLQSSELAKALAFEYATHPELISEEERHAIEKGRLVSESELAVATEVRDICSTATGQLFKSCDAILTFSATGEAPLGRGSGNAIMNRHWTMLGLPCINLPAGRGPNGLPIGVQLVGPWNSDVGLLRIADSLMDSTGLASC
jgi:Asp-tRNA(Asn)/Glu-tRNA(Gln) amidotransferase A subunit family amidase